MIRRHNVQEVINLMNDWWEIISKESKRDQLSFNYLVWKNKFSFSYLPGNPYKGNPWFYFIGNNRKNYSKKLIEYKIKKLFNRV